MESPSPQKERKSRKKLLLRIGCGALALLATLAISGWLYFRSGRFNRLLAEEITKAARDYGLRVEVGRVELGRGLRNAILHDLKIYNRETGQAVALIELAEVTLEIREPFAFRLRREIALQRVDLSGVSLWVDVNENGRSNFTGVRRPHRAPGRITFDASALIVALRRGVIRLDDRRRQVSGTLNDLYTEARATKGGAVSLKFGIGASPFSYKGRETSVYSLDIAAVVTGTGADIERLTLQSPMANATAAGRVDGWSEARYGLKTKARVTLAEAMRVFVPNVGLQGVADFDGRVEGAGPRYRASGNVTSEEVIAAGIRFLGARAEGASAGPERDEWTFSSRAAHAQKVLTKGLVFNEASVAGVRGAVRQGIARLSADQADVARFDAAQGRAEAIRLQQLSATLGGGRDEALSDMSLSIGALGEVTFGETRGQFVANRDVIGLSAFTSSVMGGYATGDVAVQTSRDRVSRLQAEFTKLDTTGLFPFIGVRNAPIAGSADGRANVYWPGAELRDLSGAITAKISGETVKTPE
ncbi:MAG TPA: hypothetical protein VFY40_21235, partial [Blastocatellia bacterium]|nr:hypothetical protein [Blastocatellia bacterium]